MIYSTFVQLTILVFSIRFALSTPLNIVDPGIIRRVTDPWTVSDFDIQCIDGSRKTLIEEELINAVSILRTTGDQGEAISSTDYYKDLFDSVNKQRANFPLEVSAKFTKLAGLYVDTKAPKTKITCNQNDHCKGPKQPFAYTQWKEDTINFCDSFFDDAETTSTTTIVTECGQDGTKTKWQALDQFFNSRSRIIVHELFHLAYLAADPNNKNADRAKDYAYGINDCKQLALGKHENIQLCFNGGMVFICPREKSFQNADTLGFIGAGVYFSQICNMKIEVKTSGATFSNLAGDDVDQTGP